MTSGGKKTSAEISDLTDKWKRALADYQNLEKRIEGERRDFVRFAGSGLILKILPALDSLERAEVHLKDEGLSLAVKQLKDVLESEGLERIKTLGEDFDPSEMECIEVAAGKEGKVVREVRAGYKLNDKILRCAQVVVAKKQKGEKNE